MKRANVKDAVAIIEFAQEIEEGLSNGDVWTELRASDRVTALRKLQKHNRGSSFSPISAYGANGAIIHYRPTNESNAIIGTDSLLLLDSGTSLIFESM